VNVVFLFQHKINEKLSIQFLGNEGVSENNVSLPRYRVFDRFNREELISRIEETLFFPAEYLLKHA